MSQSYSEAAVSSTAKFLIVFLLQASMNSAFAIESDTGTTNNANSQMRAKHKLYVDQKKFQTNQQVIPYKDVNEVTNTSSKVTGRSQRVEGKREQTKQKMPFRFAIQLGFFRDKKSLWRYMSARGLAGQDFHSHKSRNGYLLLFGRYQTMEMAAIVWEQMLFEYQDSFIVNLPKS